MEIVDLLLHVFENRPHKNRVGSPYDHWTWKGPDTPEEPHLAYVAKYPSFLKKVTVIGINCSGKTTLSKIICRKIKNKHIELDKIKRDKKGNRLPLNRLIDIVSKEIRAESWVIEGNFLGVRELVWRRSDTLVWLDLPFQTILSRTIIRMVKECRQRNPRNLIDVFEQLYRVFITLYWLINQFWKRKKSIISILSRPEMSHLKIIKLKNQKDVKRWIASL